MSLYQISEDDMATHNTTVWNVLHNVFICENCGCFALCCCIDMCYRARSFWRRSHILVHTPNCSGGGGGDNSNHRRHATEKSIMVKIVYGITFASARQLRLTTCMKGACTRLVLYLTVQSKNGILLFLFYFVCPFVGRELANTNKWRVCFPSVSGTQHCSSSTK